MPTNTPTLYRVCVLGGGSFGTALANIISRNGQQTFLWMRDVERAQRTQASRENSDYLPGYPLHEDLQVSADLALCVATSDVVVISIPSHSFREVTRQIAPLIQPNTIVVSTTKGIEADGFTLMSQILEQELQNVRIAVLSGPNFAKEIIANQYTGSVIASDHADVCRIIPPIFSSKTFRIYSNRDKYGVELGGALKNIYAIITGMAAALGCGHNTIAMLLTRSLAEMGRFANTLGADAMTFLGLAGVGDLILTCTSDLSRNYRVGYAVGKGKTLAQAMEAIGGQVAEGVNTLKIVKEKADALGIYMPLASGLYAVLFDHREIGTIVHSLMTGEMATDVEYQN